MQKIFGNNKCSVSLFNDIWTFVSNLMQKTSNNEILETIELCENKCTGQQFVTFWLLSRFLQRVFLHCWIRKWHRFSPSGHSVLRGWFEKKSDLLTKSITFLWHYQLIFVNTYHPKYVLKRKNVLPTKKYWLPDRNIYYCKLNGGHWYRYVHVNCMLLHHC